MKKSIKCNAVKTTVIAGLFAVFSLAFTMQTANAAEKGYTNYISDSLEVPVRRGAGYKFKIVRMLKTGEAVKILEVASDGWAKIQYQKKGNAHTGYIPSSLLQNQPIARDRLNEQVKKTSAVEAKYNALQNELDTLKERFSNADEELSSIKQERFELTKQLERLENISANAVQIDQQNQNMKQRLTQLENQNAIMKEQIDQSDDSVKRQWFLTGGGVLLIGLLLGRFFRPPTRRKKWGEL